jgi:hypothetical protein
MLLRALLLGGMLLLSACGGTGNHCSYYGNCGCNDWYNKCSLH